MLRLFFWPSLCLGLAACGTPSPTEQVQAYVGAELDAFLSATKRLQAHAPPPQADGWQQPRDTAALQASQQAWKDARIAYEHVEAAIAALFPEQDKAVDGRYDDFPAQQGSGEGPSPNLFNGEAITGMHGVERILWADSVIEPVRRFEATLSHYQAPAFPADAQQATDYRDQLVGRLIADVDAMQRELAANHLDLSAAFGGVLNSMKEQREKVNLAGEGSDESRYAQHTLADMRANVEGGRAVLNIFRPELERRTNGKAMHAAILARLDALRDAYDAYPGDSLPPVPAGWSSQNVDDRLLASDYGVLWRLVLDESESRRPESLVALMLQAQELLELPR